VNRRHFFDCGATAALSWGVLGCVARVPDAASVSRRAAHLVPVNCAWDRIIRTTVGHRPFRASGFVLADQKLDAKTVIHNYGHGGTGHSLGWGTGQLAAELALRHADRRAAVIGCGTVGLTATRQLQRRGFDVTIYAKSVPPDTTSNMALAGFTPTSGVVDDECRTPEWDGRFRSAVVIAFRQLQLLVGRGYGVSWLDSYSTMDELPSDVRSDEDESGESRSRLLPEELRGTPEVLGPGEHPFPLRYATRSPSLRIEPSVYLDALVRDVMRFGARIVIRSFETPRDLMTLSESLIVNCSGLGSRELFGDTELVPAKGQLTVLLPQPDVTYRTSGGIRSFGEGIGIHMMPRRDGIALGGTSERGDWSTEPDPAAITRIVEGHMELFGAMTRDGLRRS